MLVGLGFGIRDGSAIPFAVGQRVHRHAAGSGII
jgi:hypothetical protein